MCWFKFFILFIGIFSFSLCLFEKLWISILKHLSFYVNVFYEFLFKKFGLQRNQIDLIFVLIFTISIFIQPWALSIKIVSWTIPLIILGILEIYLQHRTLKILDTTFSVQDEKAPYKAPIPRPYYIAIIRGPFFDRIPVYNLNDVLEGYPIPIEIVLLNPSYILPQIVEGKIEFFYDEEFIEITPSSIKFEAPSFAEFKLLKFTIKPLKSTSRNLKIKVHIEIGGFKKEETLRINSIIKSASFKVKEVYIRRWKYGAKGAFTWRGDMDLYDPATFQDEKGLEFALYLTKRFRIPSTLFLSGRLSLIPEELKEFENHTSLKKYHEHIPDFIKFIKTKVELVHKADFPYITNKEYVLELGNHMFLHYSTYASMSEENDWTPFVQPWHTPKKKPYKWQFTPQPLDSLREQYENALVNQSLIEKIFDGYKPLSWASPGRSNDKYSAIALERAGIPVASVAYGNVSDEVIFFKGAYHPPTVNKLVELSKVYPGDPSNIYQVEMIKYRMRQAVKEGKSLVFMAHHHLKLYEGIKCYKFTEEIFRYLLEDLKGELWPTTVYGIGHYWDSILCPDHKVIDIKVLSENTIKLVNHSNEAWEKLPLEIETRDFRKLMLLIDIESQEEKIIKL